MNRLAFFDGFHFFFFFFGMEKRKGKRRGVGGGQVSCKISPDYIPIFMVQIIVAIM